MKKKILQLLWDLWCIVTIVGIWPRFIEPRLLSTTRKTIEVAGLPSPIEGVKILQFSDLHMGKHTSDQFLSKLLRTIQKLKPDIVVFTGDFICNASVPTCGRIEKLFNRINTPYGSFSVIGNHDYSHPVGINKEGDYDTIMDKESEVISGIRRVFKRRDKTKKRKVTDRAMAARPHQRLLDTLEHTSTTLLRNETKLVRINDSYLNVSGLDEHTTGHADPQQTFQSYDPRYPGIVLVHNPDAIPSLVDYPGDLILSGHTHGAQINLPWIWKKITLLENEEFKSGLKRYGKKWVYVNRGVGATFPFRWFSRPEVTLFTLKGAGQ